MYPLFILYIFSSLKLFTGFQSVVLVVILSCKLVGLKCLSSSLQTSHKCTLLCIYTYKYIPTMEWRVTQVVCLHAPSAQFTCLWLRNVNYKGCEPVLLRV